MALHRLFASVFEETGKERVVEEDGEDAAPHRKSLQNAIFSSGPVASVNYTLGDSRMPLFFPGEV